MLMMTKDSDVEEFKSQSKISSKLRSLERRVYFWFQNEKLAEEAVESIGFLEEIVSSFISDQGMGQQPLLNSQVQNLFYHQKSYRSILNLIEGVGKNYTTAE